MLAGRFLQRKIHNHPFFQLFNVIKNVMLCLCILFQMTIFVVCSINWVGFNRMALNSYRDLVFVRIFDHCSDVLVVARNCLANCWFYSIIFNDPSYTKTDYVEAKCSALPSFIIWCCVIIAISTVSYRNIHIHRSLRTNCFINS